MCGFLFMCCFFFFKQKTAYEMRISDWSSDVCSSDLSNDDRRAAPLPECGPACLSLDRCGQSYASRERPHRIAAYHLISGSVHMEAYVYDHIRTPRGKGRPDGALHEITSEIGRASSRERVCPSV